MQLQVEWRHVACELYCAAHPDSGPLFAITVASMGRISNGHVLIVVFWALRTLMSVYDLVFKVSVPMWFVKRRGTAIAVSSLISSSMLAYPSVIEAWYVFDSSAYISDMCVMFRTSFIAQPASF